jgi:FkbM family methyltransferase
MRDGRVIRALRRVWHLRRAYELAALFCAPGGRAKVVGQAAWLAAAELAGRAGARVTTLELGDLGPIAVRDFSELLVLWEVFVGRVYDVPELPDDAAVIVDLGCNVGASVIWFERRYPKARITGYEADPRTAELARRNTSRLSGIAIHAAAIAAQDGEATFHRLAGDSWASGTDVYGGDAFAVPAVSLDTVLRRAGGTADIVKFNVEGAEHAALAASTGLDRIGLVLGQYHPGPGISWETLRASLDGLELRPVEAPDDEGRPFIARRAG